MRDFTPDELDKIAEELQFADFLQDNSAAIALLNKVQTKYPLAVGSFMNTTMEYINTMRGTVSKEELDNLFNWTMNNFAFTLHALDVVNNGEANQDDIPDESREPDQDKVPFCQFGADSDDPCRERKNMTVQMGDDSVHLCTYDATELLTTLIQQEGEQKFVEIFDVDAIDFMLSKFVDSFPEGSKAELVEEILKGKVG